MYLTLLGIGIALTVFGCVLGSKTQWVEHAAWIVPLVVGVVSLIFLIPTVIMSFSNIVKIERTIDDRIELYESYNEDIKAQVDAVAMQYLDHESDIYDNFNSTEILLIVPELHSNTIIMEQIALYEANEQKLLELEEQKIDLGFKKFMLYWGS